MPLPLPPELAAKWRFWLSDVLGATLALLAERPAPLPESARERLWRQLPPARQGETLTLDELAAAIESAARRQDADKEQAG